jgi:hypothetical protein
MPDEWVLSVRQSSGHDMRDEPPPSLLGGGRTLVAAGRVVGYGRKVCERQSVDTASGVLVPIDTSVIRRANGSYPSLRRERLY